MILERTAQNVARATIVGGLLLMNVVSLAAQEIQKITVEEAIQIGLTNSRMLKISDAKIDAAEAKAGEVASNLLPSLKVSASYQRLSDVPPFVVTLPSSLPPPLGGSGFTIAPAILNNYSARVSLQQPIFTGFKLESNARSADYFAEASKFDNQNDKSDLKLNITIAYWTFYQTLQTKTYVDENVVRLQTNENDTKNLLKVGLATRNDLLKVQLQLNNTKLTQIDAANDVQLAMMNLNNIIGLPIETEIELVSAPWPPAEPAGKPFREGDKEETGQSLAVRALDKRSDLMAMQSRVEASKASVSAAQGNWWPQLFLAGGYTYARPNQRYQPTVDAFKGTWDVGVQLQFDLWNWNATGHQSEQAKAVLRQSELAFDQMKENISLEVRRQWLAVQRAKEKVQVAMLAIGQAEENQRTTNDKYKQGLATSTDALDANVALLQAKTSYSGALVEHEVARLKLNKAIGE